jgi:hypothetical protein
VLLFKKPITRVERFFLAQHTKTGKIYQKAIKDTKLFPIQGPPKYAKFVISGIKLHHLATVIDICSFS